MKTKLSRETLSAAAKANGLADTSENQLFMAFMNDPEFRENVTRFFFEKALRDVRAAR